MNDERTEPIERTLDATFDPVLDPVLVDALWDPRAVQPDELAGLCHELSNLRFQARPLDLDPAPLPGRPGRPADGPGRWVGLAAGIVSAAMAATIVARCTGPNAHDTQEIDGTHTRVAAPPQDRPDRTVSPSLDAGVEASSTAASPTGELVPTLRAPDDGTMRWAPGGADTEPAPPGAAALSSGDGHGESDAKVDIDGAYTTEWDDDFARRLSVALDAKSVAFSACFEDAGMPADADTVSVHFRFKGATGRLDRLEVHREETRLLAPERCFVEVAREIQVDSFEAPTAALVREYMRGETVHAGTYRPSPPGEMDPASPLRPSRTPETPDGNEADLPTKLTASQLFAAIQKVKPRLTECVEGVPPPTDRVTSVPIEFTIIGSTGRVSAVTIERGLAEWSPAACLREEALRAQFDRFASPVQGFTYKLPIR